MGRIPVNLKLTNRADVILAKEGLLSPEKIRRTTVPGVVNTRVLRLVIPETVAEQLGLPEMEDVGVRYPDGRRATRTIVGNMSLELLGREFSFGAIAEPDRATAVIGRMVLDTLDLVVDCDDQRLYPRDPNGITVEI